MPSWDLTPSCPTLTPGPAPAPPNVAKGAPGFLQLEPNGARFPPSSFFPSTESTVLVRVLYSSTRTRPRFAVHGRPFSDPWVPLVLAVVAAAGVNRPSSPPWPGRSDATGRRSGRRADSHPKDLRWQRIRALPNGTRGGGRGRFEPRPVQYP